jgi:lipopolysaccharide exporter
MQFVTLNRLKTLIKSESVYGRIFQGGSVLTIGSFSENLLRFIRNMILARLVAPSAFGVMATIMAVVAAAEAFAEVGLVQSILQNKKGADKEFLNVIFWFSAFRGIILYGIAFVMAPFIADFLNNPESTTILRVALIAILLRGLTSPNIYLLQKEFKFTTWVLLTQGSSILGIIIAIVSAIFFRDVWALVLGYIAEVFLILLFSYVFYPHIPKFQINLSHAKNIMSFSRKIFGLPILTVLYVQADNFVIGKVLSLNVLGLYYLARSLAEMATAMFSKIAVVFLPAFSLIQDDMEKLKKSLLELTELVATFGLPFFTLLIVFADPILTLVYSPVHGTIALPFGICCIFSFLYILSILLVNIFIATGNPDQFRTASLARTIVFLVILYPATRHFGLTGATLSALLSMSLAVIIQIRYLKSLLKVNLREYLTCFAKGIKYSLLVLIPGIIVNTFIPLQTLGAVAIGAVLCAIAWGCGIVTFSHFKNEVPNYSAD